MTVHNDGVQQILVVEDSDDDFYAFKRACRKIPNAPAIVRCRDAAEARDYLFDLSEKGEGLPILTFLDLNMPGIDGRELLQSIKSTAELRSLRVVVYSTSDAPEDVTFCYANFANAFHTKPRDFDEMRTDLESIFDYWLERTKIPVPSETGESDV